MEISEPKHATAMMDPSSLVAFQRNQLSSSSPDLLKSQRAYLSSSSSSQQPDAEEEMGSTPGSPVDSLRSSPSLKPTQAPLVASSSPRLIKCAWLLLLLTTPFLHDTMVATPPHNSNDPALCAGNTPNRLRPST